MNNILTNYRCTSSYGRQQSQDTHHYNPVKPVFVHPIDAQKAEEAEQANKRRKSSTPERGTPSPAAASRPIPLVSSVSKESEDFELIPLKDRMRAFQDANPVTKPVVSVNKTVSVSPSGR